MSVLIVDKAERIALEAEFAKMQAAGSLPGGVMLGVPLEAVDGRFVYCDARWDVKEDGKDAVGAVEKRVAVCVADAKVGVTAKTFVTDKVPADFKPAASVAPKEEPKEEVPTEDVVVVKP